MNDLQALARIAAPEDYLNQLRIENACDLIAHAQCVFSPTLDNVYHDALPDNNFELWMNPEFYPLFLVWVSMSTERIDAWMTIANLLETDTELLFSLKGNVWERYHQVVSAYEANHCEDYWFYRQLHSPGFQTIIAETEGYHESLDDNLMDDPEYEAKVIDIIKDTIVFLEEMGWV